MTQFGIESSEGGEKPSSELDLYDHALSANVDDEFLSTNNFGLGNYTGDEMWQQVESFKRGMYAEQAFVRRLLERAIHQTMVSLGLRGGSFYDERESVQDVRQFEGWRDLDEEERAEKDRREWVLEKGREVWETLPENCKREALDERAGVSSTWTPPHFRMMQVRHETGRSRDASTMEIVFTDMEKKEIKTNDMNEAEKKLFGGRSR
jgi:hypothetical protein